MSRMNTRITSPADWNTSVVKRQHCQGTKRFHRVKYKQTFWGLEWPPLGPGYSPMAQNTQINQIYDSFNTEVNISTSNLSQQESKVSKVSKF